MDNEEATVTEEQFVRYVRTFLDEYTTAVEALLDPEVRSRLARYSYLPARVIAYVSSSAGVSQLTTLLEANKRVSKAGQVLEGRTVFFFQCRTNYVVNYWAESAETFLGGW
jgi:hypothetical protein